MVSASAPGKIILFGEHAVVYGQPAIAVPVTQVQARVTITPGERAPSRVIAPALGLDACLEETDPGSWGAAVLRGVKAALGLAVIPPFVMRVESSIPVASGLGSGAAVAVAAIRALGDFLGQPFSDEQVNAIAYETEKLHHGTPSGIDNTVITLARPIYFVRGQPIEAFEVARPFTIVIGDTGIASPTAIAVGDVRKAWQGETQRYEQLFEGIGGIARSGRAAIETGDLETLGALMLQNHFWLQQLGVSAPGLDRLVGAAMRSGSHGAKLSGGGRGGNMIALVPAKAAPALAKALSEAGAVRTIITQVGQ